MQKGLIAAFGCYFLWGIMPIYWKVIAHIPATETLGHRVIWSALLLGLILVAQQNRDWLEKARANQRGVWMLAGAAVLLVVNWGIFIWAINSGYVVEASLGYFINPLLNVVFGVLIFKERLRRGQLAAVALAALGVIYLTVVYGQPPLIGLSLAFSFGFYGVLKKQTAFNAIESLFLETTILLPVAFVWIMWLQRQGNSSFGQIDTTTTVFLMLAGIATTAPLILFAYAAKRVPLSTIGLIQYLAPTLQFSLGVFLYKEPFDSTQLVGFLFIWVALAVYSAESFHYAQQNHSERI